MNKFIFIIPIAVVIIAVGLAAFYFDNREVLPVCKGDLELIDNTCQCKAGWDQIGTQCHLRDPKVPSGGEKVVNPCDEFPELCDMPEVPVPEK